MKFVKNKKLNEDYYLEDGTVIPESQIIDGEFRDVSGNVISIKNAIRFGLGFALGTALSKAISIDEKEYDRANKATDDIINGILSKYQK